MNENFMLDHSDPDSSNYLVVTWCFFNICNYDCSYCSPAYKGGTKRGPSIQQCLEAASQIFEHYKNKKFYFEFTGGEITYFPEFKTLMKYLHDHGAEVGIVSNGSKDASWWKEVGSYLKYINLSFHPESASPEHFFSVIEALRPTTNIHLNVMMLKDKFDSCYQFSEKVKVLYPDVRYSLQPIMGKDPKYDEKQKLLMRKEDFDPLFTKPNQNYRSKMKLHSDAAAVEVSPYTLQSRSMNRFKGWSCNAGLDNICIDWDGNIYRGWCKEGGLLGNLKDKTIKFPEAPIKCSKDSCKFSFDLMSKKTRD